MAVSIEPLKLLLNLATDSEVELLDWQTGNKVSLNIRSEGNLTSLLVFMSLSGLAIKRHAADHCGAGVVGHLFAVHDGVVERELPRLRANRTKLA